MIGTIEGLILVLGIVGGILLLILFCNFIAKLYKKYKNKEKTELFIQSSYFY
jgi:hypothetical protein